MLIDGPIEALPSVIRARRAGQVYPSVLIDGPIEPTSAGVSSVTDGSYPSVLIDGPIEASVWKVAPPA